jgi:hypothetical protein
MSERKSIQITGQNNRYQMKKLINENQNILKKRIEINNMNISIEYFSYERQLSLLQTGEEDNRGVYQIMLKQLEKKISGYKQQDNDKKLYDETKFITLDNVVKELKSKEMKCCYCNCEMCVLYENVREPCQWTVDRIDNDLGHNVDNYLLACLKCNIERRRTNKDKFLFTKNLKVVRTS